MIEDPAKPPETETPSFARLAWPVGILLLEATALTPFVEFTAGGMAVLANPLTLSAGIVTLTTFFLLLASQASDGSADETSGSESSTALQHGFTFWLSQPWRGANRKWILIHLVLLAAFVALTLSLQSRSRSNGTLWLFPVLWMVLGIAVAISIVRVFLKLTEAGRLVRTYLLQAIVAVVIGVSLLLMIAPVRNLWTTLDRPMLVVLEQLFNIYPGNAVIDTVTFRWPVIGASKISLLVTPPCSELESLLVFLLLGGTLWVAKWEVVSPWRFLSVILTGVFTLYLLLILRLYLLVLIGNWASDPYVSVGLAHSRVSTLALLVFSLIWLSLGSKLAVRPEPEEYSNEYGSEEEMPEEDEQPEEKEEAVTASDA